MRRLLLAFAFMNYACQPSEQSFKGDENSFPITIVVHGGAGNITPSNLTPEKEKLYHEKLSEAINAGYAVLEQGGSSEDAVLTTIAILEDSPLFNAGRGSVFTADGLNEMDASVMDGSSLMAGAVAGVKTIRNPIKAAHKVMRESDHVMLAGNGAELFAQSRGLEIVDPSYFVDSVRYKQWRRLQTDEKTSRSEDFNDKKLGTVGCVALDKSGNLFAGTSTGGMMNKRFGRIGDSPIIGAGTYANNRTCAISSTGHGEYFIRLAVAHSISSMMEYKNVNLNTAADEVIHKKLQELGGTGGIIGLSRNGDIAMTFNTEGMFRGYRRQGESANTFAFGENVKR